MKVYYLFYVSEEKILVWFDIAKWYKFEGEYPMVQLSSRFSYGR